MVQIKKINIINTLSLDFLLIQFEIEDTEEDLNNYEFDIYRSNSPEGDFELISSNVESFEYKDYTVNLYKKSISYYYKVKVRNIVDMTEELSEITGKLIYHKPDNIANAVIYSHNIYLDVVDNPKIKILIKKRFGQKCTSCWDKIRMQPKDSNCTNCYLTGYNGGYFSPIEVRMNFIDPMHGSQEHFDVADMGDINRPIKIWIENYPLTRPQDIIVDHQNRRYNIADCSPTVKNGYIIRQVLTLYQLPKSHIVYNFPLT